MWVLLGAYDSKERDEGKYPNSDLVILGCLIGTGQEPLKFAQGMTYCLWSGGCRNRERYCGMEPFFSIFSIDLESHVPFIPKPMRHRYFSRSFGRRRCYCYTHKSASRRSPQLAASSFS